MACIMYFPSGPSDRRSAFGPTGSHSERFVQGSAFGVCHRIPFSIESSRTRPGYVSQWIAMHFPLDLFYLFIYLLLFPRISTGNARQIGARLVGVERFLVGPIHEIRRFACLCYSFVSSQPAVSRNFDVFLTARPYKG